MRPADVVVLEEVWGEPLARLEERFSVRREPDALREPGSLPKLLAGARAVVVRNQTPVTRALLAAAGDLEVVARAGVGLDNIDVAAADRQGVVVVAPAGANAVSVAEHSLALALALARRIVPLDRASRSGQWSRTSGHELAGKTWGLLGAGATGRACARIAKALGMGIVGHDPYISPDHPDVVDLGLRMVGIEELAATADVLSCHLPATQETKRLIDAELLAGMRPHALLISVGRGEVIDEEALTSALAEGRLGGAGLDVRASEPPVPGRLEELPNVVLTPHIAGITTESQERIMSILATDITSVLGGRDARYAAGAVRGPRG